MNLVLAGLLAVSLAITAPPKNMAVNDVWDNSEMVLRDVRGEEPHDIFAAENLEEFMATLPERPCGTLDEMVAEYLSGAPTNEKAQVVTADDMSAVIVEFGEKDMEVVFITDDGVSSVPVIDKSIPEMYLQNKDQQQQPAMGMVVCVVIDPNTVLCAFDNPRRVVIFCRDGAGGPWSVCFDTGKPAVSE